MAAAVAAVMTMVKNARIILMFITVTITIALPTIGVKKGKANITPATILTQGNMNISQMQKVFTATPNVTTILENVWLNVGQDNTAVKTVTFTVVTATDNGIS